jgi:hypothetical protein
MMEHAAVENTAATPSVFRLPQIEALRRRSTALLTIATP